MMKAMKRFAALVLALSLLIGIPMSVSAIGTATPSDLKLIGAQAMPYKKIAPGDYVHVNGNWKDRGVLFYFSQNLTQNLTDGTGAGGVKGRLVVVDDNNEIVSIDHNGNTHYLFWNLSDYVKTPGGGNIVAHGGRLYDKTYTNADGTTTTYTGTWTYIINLLATHEQLAGKGYRLQARLYDTSSYNTGYIEKVTSANDSTIKLTATGTDTTGGAALGTAYNNRNYAAIDLGTVAAGATEITQTGMLTLDRVQMINQKYMKVTYSESVDARMSDGVSVQVQVVSADASEIIQTFSATGHSATSVSLSSNNWSDVQAVLDANEGSYARLRIQEKNPASARDEWVNNYAVDTIWGKTSQRPLQSDLMRNPGTAANSDDRDFVFCKIEVPPVLEVESVTEINDYQLELQFTQELSASIEQLINVNKNAYLGIAQILNDHTGKEAIDVVRKDHIGGTVAVGDAGNILIWTASNQDKTISERLSTTDEGYTWMFYLYDGECEYHGAGFIGGVQGVNPVDGSELALSIPANYTKTANDGKEEFMFVDIITKKNIQEKIDAAEAAGLTEFSMDSDETIHALNVSTGFTLDLNGHTLTAEYVFSYGDIKDSSGGEGIIKIAQNQTNENKLIVSQDNAMLPLYDTTESGYRFFAFELINKGQKQGTGSNPEDTNVMRYGVHLKFESKKAYVLMAEGALDMDLYMNLTTESKTFGSGGIDYSFKKDTLKEYGQACLDVFDDSTALAKKTIVLIVTGMDALNEKLQVTAGLETTTPVIPSVEIV